MKLCPNCLKEYGKMLKKSGIKIIESTVEECEMGHPRFVPELPKNKVEVLKKDIKHTQTSKNSKWGLIYIYTDFPFIPWYWWIDWETREPLYGCRPWRPDENKACDIHYEPWVYIPELKGWYGGLINFGGCEPAKNCGGNCGLVNSKRNGKCLRKYDEAPEVFKTGWIYCLYVNTGIKDCLRRTQYMILDYKP